MVTGIYHPEVNGAANQCRLLVRYLNKQINFCVLTNTRNPALPLRSQIDNADIYRILLKNKSIFNYFNVAIKIILFFFNRRNYFDIVHLHGYSLKSFLIIFLSKIFQKKVIIKMTSVGQDDPISLRKRFVYNRFFSQADAFVGIAPQFVSLYNQSKLSPKKLFQIPNGVSTHRFSPVNQKEKNTLKYNLGFPINMRIILFVGHFSREKNPDNLLDVWITTLVKTFPRTAIVFIGATKPDNFEVEDEFVKDVKQKARPYLNDRIFFIENTHEIEKYYQISDIFVLSSMREGLPNVLLEAMACGMPVISSKLYGVTDWIINDCVNGLLFEPGNDLELEKALLKVLGNDDFTLSLGLKARETILNRFSIEEIAKKFLKLYKIQIART
jgi:glycosyltransferase involved in cell wall biosynthesis